MRSALVRDEAEQYYEMNNSSIDLQKIMDIFMETYLKKDDRYGGPGKFVFDYSFKDLDAINDKIVESEKRKGILRARGQ